MFHPLMQHHVGRDERMGYLYSLIFRFYTFFIKSSQEIVVKLMYANYSVLTHFLRKSILKGRIILQDLLEYPPGREPSVCAI